MRTDYDFLGSVSLPDDVYYGVHTERARTSFGVSGTVIGDFPEYVASIALVKKAAALANHDVGALRRSVAEAICAAADEIVAGRLDRRQFPVDVMCGGGGTSPNMNVNEVIATRANEILTGRKGYEFVHPNNHVNAGQSTSDVMVTALGLTLHREIAVLIDEIGRLEAELTRKIAGHRDVVKLSRTCLQDAVPITFAQEFDAYLAVARRGAQRLRTVADACLAVPMGATVVGTGLGVSTGYVARIYPRLQEVTGLPVRRAASFFDCFQNGDLFQDISATFKAVATNLVKMSKDLRILCSGPRAGMMELVLPAVMAGSSLMPGKVNPVMPETMIQIGFQVIGNDSVVTMAVENGELDLNVWGAVIAKNLFESCRLLSRGIPLFTQKCIAGLRVNVDHCRDAAENSLALSTVVAGAYGYEAGSRVAKHAAEHHLSIRRAAVALGVLGEGEADELLDPLALTNPEASAALLHRKAAEQHALAARLCAGLSDGARTAIFVVAAGVAAADGDVSAEEEKALQAVADVLHLEPSAREMSEAFAGAGGSSADLTGLTDAERDVVYSCGVWLAHADLHIHSHEIDFLDGLRRALDLDEDSAVRLSAHVERRLAERREYIHASEELPWWENFAELLAQTLAISTPVGELHPNESGEIDD